MRYDTGENNNNAVLTNEEARAARILHAEFHMSTRELAKMYRTSHATMSNLVSGKTYKEAGGPIFEGRPAHRLGERTSQEKGR